MPAKHPSPQCNSNPSLLIPADGGQAYQPLHLPYLFSNLALAPDASGNLTPPSIQDEMKRRSWVVGELRAQHEELMLQLQLEEEQRQQVADADVEEDYHPAQNQNHVDNGDGAG